MVKRPGRYSGGCRRTGGSGSCGAFDAEFQAWIDAVPPAAPPARAAWDGYAATVACEAGLEALRTGQQLPIRMTDRPDLYA